MRPTARRVILILTAFLGIFAGVWGAGFPQSFYDAFPGLSIGPWVSIDGPYNEHLIRDVGAFYLALAAGSIYAAIRGDISSSRVIGIAWFGFSVPHLAYHLHHLEGMSTLNAVIEIMTLASTVILAIPLMIANRQENELKRPRVEE